MSLPTVELNFFDFLRILIIFRNREMSVGGGQQQHIKKEFPQKNLPKTEKKAPKTYFRELKIYFRSPMTSICAPMTCTYAPMAYFRVPKTPIHALMKYFRASEVFICMCGKYFCEPVTSIRGHRKYTYLKQT